MSREERSGWRDLAFSRRHREYWGQNCPAVDIDFLMVEYHHGAPKAIVDYKHCLGIFNLPGHPSYRALIRLAEPLGLPVLAAMYWPEHEFAMRVQPLNDAAARRFERPTEDMSEREYVLRLYRLANVCMLAGDAARLGTALPPLEADSQPEPVGVDHVAV